VNTGRRAKKENWVGCGSPGGRETSGRSLQEHDKSMNWGDEGGGPGGKGVEEERELIPHQREKELGLSRKTIRGRFKTERRRVRWIPS